MPELIEIGEVISLHGFKGEVLIHFAERLENFKNKELFFVQIDGIHVPFFVEEMYRKSKLRYAVRFEDVDNEEKAAELLNAKVFTETENVTSEETDEHAFLIGFKLYDGESYIGTVTDFLSMSANELLQVYCEAKEKEVLIPYHKALIEHIDNEKQILRCKLPEGLLDIND